MKKQIRTVLAAILAVSLAGCSKAASSIASDSAPKINIVTPEENGFATGYATDIMRTEFFDYTVNSAYLTDTFSDYELTEGNVFLVVDLTVKNSLNQSIPMFDTDFQAQWGDDENDDAFAYSVTAYGAAPAEGVLPEEYELAINEERTGKLVFQVPAGHKDFSVSYMEVYDSGEQGNTFFVYFTAQ